MEIFLSSRGGSTTFCGNPQGNPYTETQFRVNQEMIGHWHGGVVNSALSHYNGSKNKSDRVELDKVHYETKVGDLLFGSSCYFTAPCGLAL